MSQSLPLNRAISPDDLLESVRHFLTFDDVFPTGK